MTDSKSENVLKRVYSWSNNNVIEAKVENLGGKMKI
jgi:hypothetical protein